jgi:hypothetical protein
MDSQYRIFNNDDEWLEKYPIANKKMKDLVRLLEDKLPGVKWSFSINDNSYIDFNGCVVKRGSINVGIVKANGFWHGLGQTSSGEGSGGVFRS